MSNSSTRQNGTFRFLAILSVVGPLWYTIIVFVLGLLQPDYNHITQSMSELGATNAPHAFFMNTLGLPVLGLSMIAFAYGLHQGISDARGSKIGPTLISVSGTALVMTGIFRCDPGCIDTSIIGVTHSIFATIAALSMILAPLTLSPRLKRDTRWKSYLDYTLATAFLSAAISLTYGLNLFESWKGTLQRISMAVPLIWIEFMAVKLLRL